jgi:hypothetical protein
MVELTAMEFQNSDRREIGDDATSTVPRIVNGLTVRPRKKINLWWGFFGILLLPDIAALLVIVGVGIHRLLRYLDANKPKES